jgi:Predicted acyltransferase
MSFRDLLILVGFLFCTTATAQNLPDTIRGYKVHKEIIAIKKPSTEKQAIVTIGNPEATDISLTGVELEFPVEIFSPGQSGKVDFLTFHDIRVNDISVEVPEYTTKFEFRKGTLFQLPEPAKVFLPTTRIIRAAWSEMRDSRNEWTVTGRVFVFGKFRKFGFHHKRVVPIDFTLVIPNPLKK